MALLPPKYLDAVVAIGVPRDDDATLTSYVATGFIYGHSLPIQGGKSTYATFLITNRHVFEGKSLVRIRFNTQADKRAEPVPFILNNEEGNPKWRHHPDPNIDVAVAVLNLNEVGRGGYMTELFPDNHTITLAQAGEIGISEGDDVFTIGFPLGLAGEERNFAIVRHGVIARLRDALEGASKEILIDSLIFPGNSGGPVVTRPQTVHIQGTRSVGRACLIGMIAKYLSYRDVAISPQTKETRVVFTQNSGLASVIPIDYVQEVIRSVLPPENN